MDPTSPYYPDARGPADLRGWRSEPQHRAPNLAGGGNAIWTDPYNDRYSGNLNTEQRALLTFSGSNAGWDYTAAQLQRTRTTTTIRWLSQ